MQSNDQSYTAPPFPAFPCTSRYVPVGSVDAAFQRVSNSIDARETISLIVGPPGTGKSLICRLLADRYAEQCDVVTLGETPIETRQDFLQHVVYQLQLSVAPGIDPQLPLTDYLCRQSTGGGLLILIDEAQSLSKEVIEAIRMVTNIMRDGEPCVTTVLCGGMKLDELLVDPALDAFTQRISTRCYLHPMTADETRQYVCQTIEACGSEPADTMTPEAIAAVHHACGGIPRLINQMLTQAIEFAAETDQVLISEEIVDQAWAELQQLPSPIVATPKVASKSAPIEFGELDEEETPQQTVNDDLELDPTAKEEPAVEQFFDGDEVVAIETIDHFDPTASAYQDVVVRDVLVDETNWNHANTVEVDSHEPVAIEANAVNTNVVDTNIVDNSAAVQSDVAQQRFSTEAASLAERDLVMQSERDDCTVEPRQTPAPTLTKEALFGDFEEEEEISIGNTFAAEKTVPDANSADGLDPIVDTPSQPHSSDTNESGAEINSAADLAATADNDADHLEEVLHQEIIGISQMTNVAVSASGEDSTVDSILTAAWPEEIREPEANIEPTSDVESPVQVESGIEWVVEDDDASDSSEPQTMRIAAAQADTSVDGESTDDVEADESLSLKVPAAETDRGTSADDIQLGRDDSDMLVIEDELELRRVDPAARRDSHDKTISVDFEAMLARMRSGT